MTVLSKSLVRAQIRWHFWPTHALARVLEYLKIIVESCAEGQEMARAAHKRCPFAE